MIKGVNRQVVEVRETRCDYFEKIIFFVKPEYASLSEGKIRERASLIAGDTPLPPPTKTPDNRVTGILKNGLSRVVGRASRHAESPFWALCYSSSDAVEVRISPRDVMQWHTAACRA